MARGKCRPLQCEQQTIGLTIKSIRRKSYEEDDNDFGDDDDNGNHNLS